MNTDTVITADANSFAEICLKCTPETMASAALRSDPVILGRNMLLAGFVPDAAAVDGFAPGRILHDRAEELRDAAYAASKRARNGHYVSVDIAAAGVEEFIRSHRVAACLIAYRMTKAEREGNPMPYPAGLSE